MQVAYAGRKSLVHSGCPVLIHIVAGLENSWVWTKLPASCWTFLWSEPRVQPRIMAAWVPRPINNSPRYKAVDTDIALWSTVRQAEAIRNGETTSRALLEHFIARIERINPALNAVVTADFERARAAADSADAALARGDVIGPLHGVPVTIKDALQTKGLRSTGGATELRDNVPQSDAAVVQAITEAGAIIMGKTNLPRWSGDLQSFNDIFICLL